MPPPPPPPTLNLAPLHGYDGYDNGGWLICAGVYVVGGRVVGGWRVVGGGVYSHGG